MTCRTHCIRKVLPNFLIWQQHDVLRNEADLPSKRGDAFARERREVASIENNFAGRGFHLANDELE